MMSHSYLAVQDNGHQVVGTCGEKNFPDAIVLLQCYFTVRHHAVVLNGVMSIVAGVNPNVTHIRR